MVHGVVRASSQQDEASTVAACAWKGSRLRLRPPHEPRPPHALRPPPPPSCGPPRAASSPPHRPPAPGPRAWGPSDFGSLSRPAPGRDGRGRRPVRRRRSARTADQAIAEGLAFGQKTTLSEKGRGRSGWSLLSGPQVRRVRPPRPTPPPPAPSTHAPPQPRPPPSRYTADFMEVCRLPGNVAHGGWESSVGLQELSRDFSLSFRIWSCFRKSCGTS